MNDLMLMAHELLCLALVYTVFCRIVPMDRKVRLDVRIVFWCLGAVACLGIPAPVSLGFHPSPFSVLLLAVIVAVQLVTSRYWTHGVPYSFYKPQHAPKRRASDRNEVRCGHC